MGAVVAAIGLGLACPTVAQTAKPLRVPFSIVADHIVVPVTLKGRNLTALLDSGAPHSMIDSAMAQRLDMQPDWVSRLFNIGQGQANGMAVQTLTTSELGVGGWSAPTRVTLADLGVLRRGGLPSIILGADLFERWVVELDFDRRVMLLHPREGFSGPAGAVLLPVEGRDHHYTTMISVEGAAPKAAHIDLGSDNPLMLNQAYARSIGVLEGRRITQHAYTGLGIQGVEGLTAVREVSLGGMVVRNVPTALPPDNDPVFGSLPINLGLPLLSRFHVWMDLAGGRLWLAPGGGFDRPSPAWTVTALNPDILPLAAARTARFDAPPTAATGLLGEEAVAMQSLNPAVVVSETP